MGNAGSATSRSTQNNNTNIVTNNDLTLVNKSINDFISNTIVTQASKCSAAIQQLQKIDFSNVKLTGGIDIGEISQTQTSNITFDCVQLSQIKNDIANGVLEQIANAIQANYTTDAITKMAAASQASGSSGFASTPGIDTTSISENNYNFNAVTNINQNIENTIKNSITNNMKSDTIQNCISNISATQSVNFSGASGTYIKIGLIRQDQAASLLASCIQSQGIANAVTNTIVRDLGLQVSNTGTVKTETQMEATSKAETVNAGFFQSIGEGIANVLKGFGDMLGKLFSMPGFTVVCIVIVIICMIGIAIKFKLFKFSKSSSAASSATNSAATQGAFKEIAIQQSTSEISLPTSKKSLPPPVPPPQH